MEENKIVKYDSGQLQKVGNQIAITKKLVSNTNEKLAIDYFNKGRDCQQLKDYEGALLYFTKAIELKSDYGEALLHRASSFCMVEDYHSAITDITEYIRLKPNSEKGYFERGLFKRHLKDYQGSLNDYNKAIELNPKDSLSYVFRAFLKEEIGDKEGSDLDWKQALQLDEDVKKKTQNV